MWLVHVSPFSKASLWRSWWLADVPCSRFMLVKSILKHRFVWACVCLHAARGWFHPLTHASPPLTSHSQGHDRRAQYPTVTFLLSDPCPPPPLTPTTVKPSHMYRCSNHLPVSQSHIVSSDNLGSQTEELLASGAEGGHVQYRGGCHGYMWL